MCQTTAPEHYASRVAFGKQADSSTCLPSRDALRASNRCVTAQKATPNAPYIYYDFLRYPRSRRRAIGNLEESP